MNSAQDISQRAGEIIDQFAPIAEWETRYKRVIEWGKNLPPLAEHGQPSANLDRFLIEGCVSKAWLVPSRSGAVVNFAGDSEAAIVKGILALLIHVYSGATPSEILSFPADFLQRIGLTEQLSMNRRNGLSQVIKQIKLYASVFAAQDKLAAPQPGTPPG